MKSDVVPVEIRGILPANSGCAIFLGNAQKVFVIQVEHGIGQAKLKRYGAAVLAVLQGQDPPG